MFRVRHCGPHPPPPHSDANTTLNGKDTTNLVLYPDEEVCQRETHNLKKEMLIILTNRNAVTMSVGHIGHFTFRFTVRQGSSLKKELSNHASTQAHFGFCTMARQVLVSQRQGRWLLRVEGGRREATTFSRSFPPQRHDIHPQAC